MFHQAFHTKRQLDTALFVYILVYIRLYLRDVMSVKHALLGFLTQKPRHGYELKQVFEEKMGDFWSLNYGQVYTTLERLYADGLVEYDPEVQDDKPDRKVYRITSTGREEFKTWLFSPIKTEPRTLRDELFLRLVFIAEEDTSTIFELIQSQKSVYMAHMMRLTNRKYEIERRLDRQIQQARTEDERQRIEYDRVIETLLLDVALYHAEADIRWLQHCETKINSLFRSETDE